MSENRHQIALVVGTMLLCASCADIARRAAEPPVSAGAREAAPAWQLLGSYSTRFDIDQTDRNHNIRSAIQRLDGAIIAPGQRWSFNQAVGQRTLARGFRIAPVLEFEGAVPALGGGICQVSSTVYNAALLADTRVAERHPHSRPVAYIPLGRDATVSWGSKDLQLVNPHAFPLRLKAFVKHERVVVQVYAPGQLGYEVRITTGDVEPASPRREYQTQEGSDRAAVGGLWVKLYRHRLRDGSVYETEKVGRSSFYPFQIKVLPR